MLSDHPQEGALGVGVRKDDIPQVTGNWSLHPHLYLHEYRDGAKFMLEGAPPKPEQ